MRGEGLAGAMQFAAHGIGGLADERGDFVVAQFLVRDEQQQQLVFVGQGIEGFLDALAEFLGFQDAQRRIGRGGGIFPDCFVRAGDKIAAVPALPEIVAMIDGDAIEPRPRRRVAAKIAPLFEGLEKNVMRRVLGLVRLAQQPERQIKNLPAVGLIQLRESVRREFQNRTAGAFNFDWIVHERFHYSLTDHPSPRHANKTAVSHSMQFCKSFFEIRSTSVAVHIIGF